jgi:hypothetical protein
MSPLAIEIYKQLRQHVHAQHAAIPPGATPPADAPPGASPRMRASIADASTLTYKELVDAVGRANPSLATHPRNASFHAALGEVSAACRAAGLPCLPAIVCRRDTRRPSAGYYKAAHPLVRSDDGREKAWRREHARVLAEIARFPEVLP